MANANPVTRGSTRKGKTEDTSKEIRDLTTSREPVVELPGGTKVINH